MEFQTTSALKRPVRLPAWLRRWAWESMHGKYGTEAMQTPYIEIEDERFEALSDIDKYDRMIKEIAARAPIRICEEEMVSGSATLGAAIQHVVPAFYKKEKVFFSVSHLTLDYATALHRGIEYYAAKISEKLQDASLSERQKRFLQSLTNVIESLKIYHGRYLKAAKDKKPEIYRNLLQVPFKPARNFYEAVQSLWFLFSFVRLCGNWPGIGRIDRLLGEYLERDLRSGALTKKAAREILASFFIKGTEWIQADTPAGSGDAQHYQNIVLAGTDESGKEIANDVTYLVLDIVEELGISDFPITVRIHERSPAKLLNKVARVIRLGGGVVAVYNETLILKALARFGYAEREARDFANDGCWEVQIPGKTRFTYIPFDSLALLQHETLKEYGSVSFPTFEHLYRAYVADLRRQVEGIFGACSSQLEQSQGPDGMRGWKSSLPCSMVSLFENDCIEKGYSYLEGGAAYTVFSPHIGGIADTVNSLYAIKKLVFDEKKLTLRDFFAVLRDNWAGREDLRQAVFSYRYYGTDNDEVDAIYSALLHDFYLACEEWNRVPEFLFVPGVSTFGREIEWLPYRLSAPEGTTAGTILAGNASPTPGTDTEGVTAVIKSYCKADLTEMVTGTALDLKISPKTLSGENGIAALKSLLLGFIRLGGFFVQIDTVSAQTLKAAQKNPQEYKTLSVRVSGWNARFVTLTKEWQDMIIQRTEYNA